MLMVEKILQLKTNSWWND